jgi:hypothetical protein
MGLRPLTRPDPLSDGRSLAHQESKRQCEVENTASVSYCYSIPWQTKALVIVHTGVVKDQELA